MQAPENAMFHRQLILAYSFTWVLQLGYLGYVLRRHLAGRAGSRESGPPSDRH